MTIFVSKHYEQLLMTDQMITSIIDLGFNTTRLSDILLSQDIK